MVNQLETLRIFCVATESPSFREAAIRLGISPQGVTRAVKELERHFGEVLFYRNTRQVRVTEFGEQLALRARQALGQMDQLFHSNRPQEGEVPTRVRIAAPTSLGRLYVVRALSRLARENQNIVLDVRLADEIADVVDEQIDVGVRIGFFRDSRFIARPVGNVHFVIAASPDLVARTGTPPMVEELSRFPTTAFVDRNTGRAWPWYFAEGKQFTPAAPAFVTDDPEVEVDAVLAGLGFGQLPRYLAAPHLRTGRLVTVLDAQAPAPWEVYVYRPQRGPVAPRIRLIFDQMVAGFTDPDLFPDGF